MNSLQLPASSQNKSNSCHMTSRKGSFTSSLMSDTCPSPSSSTTTQISKVVCGRFPQNFFCGCTIPCKIALEEVQMKLIIPGLYLGPVQAAFKVMWPSISSTFCKFSPFFFCCSLQTAKLRRLKICAGQTRRTYLICPTKATPNTRDYSISASR